MIGDVDRELLVGVDPQEVHVHDLVAHRVPLELLDDRQLPVGAHVEADQLVETGLATQRGAQLAIGDRERDGLVAQAVQDARDLVLATQAPGRAGPELTTKLCLQNQFGHDTSPVG